jgi:hypothetical protein
LDSAARTVGAFSSVNKDISYARVGALLIDDLR